MNSDTKKALIISHRFPFPPNKGEKIRTFHQSLFLQEQGFTVSIKSLSDDPIDVGHAEVLEKTYDIKSTLFPIASGISRLVNYAYALLSGKSFTEAHFASSDLARELAQLSLSDYQVILLTGSGLTPYLAALKSASRTSSRAASASSGNPIITPLKLLDFMDVDSDKWLQYQEKSSGLKRLIYRREAKKVLALEQRASELADTCFLISQNEVDRFQELHSAALEHSALALPLVLGNGVSFDAFPAVSFQSIDINTPAHFVFMGVMDYLPNEDAARFFALDIFPTIRNAHPNARFTIVGMNPSEEVSALSNLPGVTVTGLVESVQPFLEQAHIFVSPFRLARGVQNKVLQAMSSQLAVVSSAMGNEGINAPALHYETTAGGAITHTEKDESSTAPATERMPALYIANNAQSFASACLDLLDDESKRRALAVRGRAFVLRKFSWTAQLAPLGQCLRNHGAPYQPNPVDANK